MAIATDIIDRTLSTKHGEQALAIVEILSEAGHDAWWVGGGVRDMILGHIPDDIDIATDALPGKIAELFPKTDETSAQFGSVLVSKGGCVFEVTTFREDDTASDGRHPESVQFGDRAQDAHRRDFTINAIYWHPVTGELYDPYEGIKDLQESMVRFIGNADERIEHDALRMLRAIRFRAHIDGQYHPDTYRALQTLSGTIEVLSGTRRMQEIEKMLMGPHPDRAFEDLWETGILEFLLPELYRCRGIPQPADYHKEGDVWEHTLKCIASTTHDHSIDVRIAALFHDVGKVDTFSQDDERIRFDEHASVSEDLTKEALDRLQCPAKRRDKICWLIKHHMMMGSFDDMNNVRKSHWYYHPWFLELLQLFWIDIAGTEPSHFDLYESIIKDYNKFLDEHPKPPKPLLSGDEVMDILGIQPGEKVGEILKTLYEKQMAKELTKKAEAEEFIKSL